GALPPARSARLRLALPQGPLAERGSRPPGSPPALGAGGRVPALLARRGSPAVRPSGGPARSRVPPARAGRAAALAGAGRAAGRRRRRARLPAHRRGHPTGGRVGPAGRALPARVGSAERNARPRVRAGRRGTPGAAATAPHTRPDGPAPRALGAGAGRPALREPVVRAPRGRGGVVHASGGVRATSGCPRGLHDGEGPCG